MKKLCLIFLIMNLITMLIAPSVWSESIQDIIANSHNDTQKPADAIISEKTATTGKANTFFAVQFGTFFTEAEANEQIVYLTSKGIDPYIFQSVNSKGTNIYATRAGKYHSYSEANQSVNKLEKTIITPMIIVYFDSIEPASSSLAASSSKTDDFSSTVSQSERNNEPVAQQSNITVNSSTLEILQNKINELENAIQKIQDESEIREQLMITEEEQKAEEEDILEAAGREYTLTQEGIIKLSYSLGYSYSAYDAIRDASRVEDVADHTITNALSVSYGLKDNLTVGTSVPFIYKYHKVGTIESLDTTDFGDLSLNWQLQPLKSGSDLPSFIVNGSLRVPVGRSPYEIQVGEELSTSSGIYSAGLGLSVSQVSDPVIVFSSLSVSYPFATQSINQKRNEGTLDEVDPGMGIGAAVGLGYALSYKLNFNLSFSYSYSFETKYKYKDAPDASSGTSTGASLSIGTGYKLSRNQNLNFSIGIPITSTRSFSLSLSTPIDFEL